MKKEAYFIIGPESSGTRMLTQAFLSLEGMYGDGGHAQKLDKEGFGGGHPKIVIRRSVPHGIKMPPIASLITQMEEHGYIVHPVVIVRDKDMCVKSQVKRKHADDANDSRESIKKAVDHIYKQLAIVGKTPHVIYYEPFVKFKKVRVAFFRQFDLQHPNIKIFNANLKY